ncbi:ribosome biogenesis factor YjgA [Pseudomonadota bacterium]
MTEQTTQDTKSKSQVKRELQALRALGVRLVNLPTAQLAKISMSEKLREAITQAKSFTRTALRRQLSYIGGLIPEEDYETIQRELENLDRPQRQEVKAFHEIELWRDALIANNEELLAELIERFADIDRQHIRQLIRNANKEKQQNKPPKSSRALFRYLSELQSRQS